MELRKCNSKCEFFTIVERPCFMDSFDGYKCTAINKPVWMGDTKKDCPFNKEVKNIKFMINGKEVKPMDSLFNSSLINK